MAGWPTGSYVLCQKQSENNSSAHSRIRVTMQRGEGAYKEVISVADKL